MTDHHKLADLRKTYEHGSLDDEAAAAEPLAQFSAWLGEGLPRWAKMAGRLRASC